MLESNGKLLAKWISSNGEESLLSSRLIKLWREHERRSDD